MSGHFKDWVVWGGNPERCDVSILLWKLRFDDKGDIHLSGEEPTWCWWADQGDPAQHCAVWKEEKLNQGEKKASFSLEYTDKHSYIEAEDFPEQEP